MVQIANMLLPLLSIPHFVRVIGPEKFGLINYSGAIVGYFVLLVNYSFNLSATRKVSQNNKNKIRINDIFNEVLGSQIILWLVSFLIFLCCLFYIPVFKDNYKLFMVTYLITISCVFTPDWLYQGMGDLQIIAFFNLLSKTVLTILIIYLINDPIYFYWQPLLISIIQILTTLISLFFALYKYKLNIKLPCIIKLLQVLNENKSIFFSSIIISLYTTTNIVILGSIVGKNEVGYFTAAQKFILIVQSLILVPLSNSLFPFIGEEFSKSIDNGILIVKKIAPLILIFTFIISIFLFFLGPWFLEAFYGNGFFKSKTIFKIMSFVPFIISISNLYGIQILLNMKLDKIFFKIISIGSIVSIFINLTISKFYGGLGAAYAWLFTEFFISSYMAFSLFKSGIQIFSIDSFRPTFIYASAKEIFEKIKK